MIFSVITIIFAIISFFNPWFFIGSIIGIVATIVEYIVEVFTANIFDNGILIITAVILGAAALILAIISIVLGIKEINAANSSKMLINLLANCLNLQL